MRPWEVSKFRGRLVRKTFVAAITLLSMTTSLVAPAFAGGEQNHFSDSSDARAGFYLRIPFAGGLKPSEDSHLSYGFNVGVGMSLAQNSFMDPRRDFRADMLKLSFSTRGFDNLTISGQSIIDRNAVWFGAADGDENSKGAWGYAFLGVGAVALGVLLLTGGGCPPGTKPLGDGCAHVDPPPPPPPS